MGNFKTKNQQIKILREKNIQILNGTGNILLESNYNELIKKYGTIFLDTPNCNIPNAKYKKMYKTGTTVHEIYAFMQFDRKLANTLIRVILEIEEKVKSVFVYYTCLLKGQGAIYNINCYDPNADKKQVFKNINYMFKLISENIDKDFVNSDFSKYGHVPLYVLSEFITLGTLYKLLNTIDPTIAIKTAHHFGLSVTQLKTFVNLLGKFRNACAHNNVVYCYNHSKAAIAPTIIHSTYNLSTGESHIYNKNLFACLIVIRHFMKKREFNSFLNEIKQMLQNLDNKTNVFTTNQVLSFSGIPVKFLQMLKY